MKNFTVCLFLFCCIFLSSCKDDICGCAPPFETQLTGEWKWIKTVTPTKTITAEQTGINRNINFLNDNTSDLVRFYEGDSLKVTLVRMRTGSATDEKKRTFLVKFYSGEYMKYYMADGQILETSELMKEYSEKADTVRHFYQFVEHVRL